MYEYNSSLVFLHEVLVFSTIKKLKQQRFWATYFNRRWTFFLLGQRFSRFCQNFRANCLYKSKETWQKEKMWYPQGTLNDKRPYFRLKCVALKRLPNKLLQLVLRTDSTVNRTLNGCYKLPLGFFRHSRYYRRWTLRKKQTSISQTYRYTRQTFTAWNMFRWEDFELPNSIQLFVWYCMHWGRLLLLGSPHFAFG